MTKITYTVFLLIFLLFNSCAKNSEQRSSVLLTDISGNISIKDQGNYCFFLNGFYANNTLWSSIANKGKELISIINFKTGKKTVSWASDGWLGINFYQNDYFYSSINPIRIGRTQLVFSK